MHGTCKELPYLCTQYFGELWMWYLQGVNLLNHRQVDFWLYNVVNLLMHWALHLGNPRKCTVYQKSPCQRPMKEVFKLYNKLKQLYLLVVN